MRKNNVRVWTVSVLAVAMAGIIAVAVAADQSAPPKGIFEYDLTGTPAIYAGEPEIAIDPANPRIMAAIAYAHGSPEFPVYQLGNSMQDYYRDIASPFGGQNGDIYITTDGGYHWKTLPRPNPAAMPPVSTTPFARWSGGDPMIAIGPHGAIYVAEEVDALWRERPGYPFDLPDAEPAIAASDDLGKTWTKPREFHTPVDRPWLTVDQSTGTVYSASSGWLDLAQGTHNIPSDGIMDRWLVAYEPMLKGQTSPRRMGGPDFAATVGDTMAAANGIIAATFAIAPSKPLGIPMRAGLVNADPDVYPTSAKHVVLNGRYIPPPNVPFTVNGTRSTAAVPASLRSIVPSNVTQCTADAPCLFMESSKDKGLHWMRHYVPMPGGFTYDFPGVVNLAADARHPGRYAIGVLSRDLRSFRVVVTKDFGATWSTPAEVRQIGPEGDEFKNWMAYGPTGVLGFMWRQQRNDMLPATKAVSFYYDWTDVPQYGFDVYDDISCDGGFHWEKPVRVDAVTSAASNTARHDDVSYIALGGGESFLIWGDRRDYPKVRPMMVPGAIGGTHAEFARVPFSVLTGGAECGR